MTSFIDYDNVKDLCSMVNDTVEFIMQETYRIANETGNGKDPNTYILVSQNIAFSFVLNVMRELHKKHYLFIGSLKQDGDHLPINGPDFFRGMEP